MTVVLVDGVDGGALGATDAVLTWTVVVLPAGWDSLGWVPGISEAALRRSS